MVVGQANNALVGFIVQARMESTRLPNKVLMPIPYQTGKPLLQWITDELKKSQFNHKIIVATSRNPGSDAISNFCDERDLTCFRGEENDVLSRFIAISKLDKFDLIVRLTGDNPIIDIGVLDGIIKNHLENQNDYTFTVGLPIGMNFEVINPESILGLEGKELTVEEKEHVTLHIRNNDRYKKGNVIYQSNVYSGLRLSVDYPSDFVLLSIILTQVNDENPIGLNLIDKMFNANAWLFDVNNLNFQIKHYINEEEELKAAVVLLEKYKLNRVAQKIKLVFGNKIQ